MTFTEAAKRFAPWSMSKAERAKNCSYAFNLKYIQRIKGEAPPANAANRIGKSAHQVLEDLLKETTEPLNKLKRLLHKAAIDFELTSPEIEELMSFTYNVARFHGRLERFKEKKGVTRTLIEHRFGLQLNLKPTTFWGEEVFGAGADDRGRPVRDVFFRGVWDLVMVVPDYIVIIDHKSGVPPKKPEDVKAHYGHQLNLYAVAALCLFPGIKGVQPALHFLQSEEIIWSNMLPVEQVKEKLVPWYTKYINEAAAAISTNTPKKGWYCSFCEYATRCPLKT